MKIVRHIQPIGMRVLVRILRESDQAESGLYLPQGAKEKMQEAVYAEVIDVARAEVTDVKEDGLGVNVSGIPNGSRVLFAKAAGIRVPWDEELRILETKEILATVEEIRQDELV